MMVLLEIEFPILIEEMDSFCNFFILEETKIIYFFKKI